MFSDEDIEIGDFIGAFEISESVYCTKFSLWLDGIRYRALGILKYSNYASSHKANAIVEFPNMYAKKRIRAGTEITWDYGDE